jgi:hypothetical protein
MKLNCLYLGLILTILSSCKNEEIKPKKEPIKKNIKKEIKSTDEKIECKYDSIAIEITEEIDVINKETGEIKILNTSGIKIIKPYLTDSLTHKYACCPDTIIGNLKVFSNNQVCNIYEIAPLGARVEMDHDYNNIILVPGGYQHRIYIPYRIWKKIISQSKRVLIKS